MSIAGETIDYGPCAFLDAYDPAAVFSSIDEAGRYAYGRQPRIAAWNLARLAEALLPLLAPDPDAAVRSAQDAIGRFGPRFEATYLRGLRAKVGIASEEAGDDELTQDLLARMQAAQTDWTLGFRSLPDAADRLEPAPFGDWGERWLARLAREPGDRGAAIRAVNPLYIPRNHLVEAALQAAIGGDLAPFEALLDVLALPYERRPGLERFALPPSPGERVLATFCGT